MNFHFDYRHHLQSEPASQAEVSIPFNRTINVLNAQSVRHRQADPDAILIASNHLARIAIPAVIFMLPMTRQKSQHRCQRHPFLQIHQSIVANVKCQ